MKEMNILLGSNEKYLKYASVLIASLIRNNSEVHMNIFYVYNGSESKDFKDLAQYIMDSGASFEIIKPDMSLFASLATTEYFSIEVYYTLFPHLFLPTNIDRVLYLDIDTLVCKNLWDFYSTDFNGKLLIAAGPSPNYAPPEKYNIENAKRGGYFNSGVIIFNLNDMRDSMPFEKYGEVIKNSKDFFFDQGMLNYLFCEKTLYVDTMSYNYRFNLAMSYPEVDKKITQNNEIYIIHYTATGLVCKPWDVLFTDREVDIISKSNPSQIKNGMGFMNKELNKLFSMWWSYAEYTPFYNKLHDEMQAKKEYVIRFSIFPKINNLFKKCDKYETDFKYLIEKKQRFNSLIAEKKMSHLLALRTLEKCSVCIRDHDISHVDELHLYFENLKFIDHILFISVRDTAAKYFKDFCVKSGLELQEELKYRQSMISVIENGHIIKSETANKEITYSCLLNACSNESSIVETNDPETLIPKYITVVSKGFDEKSKDPTSSIMINNIDYSMNMIGLNIVVFSKKEMCVIDSININTHNDLKLTIRR